MEMVLFIFGGSGNILFNFVSPEKIH